MFTRRIVIVLALAVVCGVLVIAGIGVWLVRSSRESTIPTGPAVELTAAMPAASADRPQIYALKIDLDAIGPAGPGRDLTIMNCDYCHSWICAVRGQRTVNHWNAVARNHQVLGRVLLNDRDWATLLSYLQRNFDDNHPVPTLPAVYEGFGCSYAEGGI